MWLLKQLFGFGKVAEATTGQSQRPDEMIDPSLANIPHNEEDDYVRVGLTRELDEEEKEMVCLVISAIVAGDNPNAQVKIHSVVAIDEDKEAAAVIATAVAASEQPHSLFKLLRVEQL